MKFIETLTKAGSKKFGVIVQYGISAPQYESNDEIESEAPDKATFADIVFVNCNRRLFDTSTQGNKGGVREALETFLESLEEGEVVALREMSLEDRSSVILDRSEEVAKACAEHDESAGNKRLSATTQRGRQDGLKQKDIDDQFRAETKAMTSEEIAEALEYVKSVRAQR